MKRSQSRKNRKPYDPYVWIQVRVQLFCHLGNHDVAPGAFVRRRRGDYRGFNSCDTCLARQGVHRPSRHFVFVGNVQDTKARQSGEDE